MTTPLPNGLSAALYRDPPGAQEVPTGRRRAAAFALDGVAAYLVILLVDLPVFSGLPAALFLMGVHRATSETVAGRCLGKWIVGIKVAGLGERRQRRARSCVSREAVFWLVPGLFLLSQIGVAASDGAGLAIALLLSLSLMVFELGLLGADAVVCFGDPERRALHDQFAGTVVVRPGRDSRPDGPGRRRRLVGGGSRSGARSSLLRCPALESRVSSCSGFRTRTSSAGVTSMARFGKPRRWCAPDV